MTIHPSHFGCVKSSILKPLKQMYIDGSCPNFGIGIKISDALIGPSVIDPNEGCCIARCTFLLTHIISKTRDKLKKPTKEPFYIFPFDDTEEKFAVRFEVDDRPATQLSDHSLTYTVTLCQYLNPENELPIDPSRRLLCVAHPVRDHEILQNKKCLKIILKRARSAPPF